MPPVGPTERVLVGSGAAAVPAARQGNPSQHVSRLRPVIFLAAGRGGECRCMCISGGRRSPAAATPHSSGSARHNPLRRAGRQVALIILLCPAKWRSAPRKAGEPKHSSFFTHPSSAVFSQVVCFPTDWLCISCSHGYSGPVHFPDLFFLSSETIPLPVHAFTAQNVINQASSYFNTFN